MYLIQDLGKKKNKDAQFLVFSYQGEEMTIVDKSNDLDELMLKYNPHKLVDEFFVSQKDFDLMN